MTDFLVETVKHVQLPCVVAGHQGWPFLVTNNAKLSQHTFLRYSAALHAIVVMYNLFLPLYTAAAPLPAISSA